MSERLQRLQAAKRPWYGQIRAAENPEAAKIWRTRFDEPPFCDGHVTPEQLVTDPDDEMRADYGRKLWLLVEKLGRKHANVLAMRYMHSMTLEEIGAVYGLHKERIRQIELQALEKVRRMAIREAFEGAW